jgi:UPF0042 nucleotide-binding protein
MGLGVAMLKVPWTPRLSSRRQGRRARHAALRPGWARLGDLVVFTGLSGAGKSTAMAVFEDAGYFCAENLPQEMIRSLVELFQRASSPGESTVPGSDVRGGVDLDWLRSVRDHLAASEARYVVFLDADDPSLVDRNRETRRRRPISGLQASTNGIANQRAALEPLGDRSLLMNTERLSTATLPRRLADERHPSERPIKPAVTLTSFGHKHGPLREAGLVFDVSFLPNPPELKVLANILTLCYEHEVSTPSGLDAEVMAYIDRHGRLDEFCQRLTALMDYLVDRFVGIGKPGLVLGIGCSGGRHRSVVVAERLGAHCSSGQFVADVVHRDIDQRPVAVRAVADWSSKTPAALSPRT